MAIMEDLSGTKHNRWTVNRFAWKIKKNSYWHCQCECGTFAVVGRGPLISGNSKSCGCLRDELASKRAKTHGYTGTSIYLTWKNIHSRCENKSNVSYIYYGARGIKVCKRWKTFELFFFDMFPTWAEGMSIERLDNNKNYEPSNCIWIPKKDQSKNRRTNIEIDTLWGRMICADAARKLKISPASFCRRMQRWPKNKWFDKAKR